MISSSPKPAAIRPETVHSLDTNLSSLKVNPQKPPTRRSVPATTYRKSTERLPSTSRDEVKTTPLQRRSFNTSTGPQKPIPTRQSTLKPRSNLTTSMNTSTLSDKAVLSTKNQVLPIGKSSPLVPKRNTLGSNTSHKVPNTSRPTSLSSSGTPKSSRFGFPKNKLV